MIESLSSYIQGMVDGCSGIYLRIGTFQSGESLGFEIQKRDGGQLVSLFVQRDSKHRCRASDAIDDDLDLDRISLKLSRLIQAIVREHVDFFEKQEAK